MLISVDDPEKCRKGETAITAFGRTLSKVVFEKSPAIYQALFDSMKIDAIVSALIPLTVFEFEKGRKKYLESYAKKIAQQLI